MKTKVKNKSLKTTVLLLGMIGVLLFVPACYGSTLKADAGKDVESAYPAEALNSRLKRIIQTYPEVDITYDNGETSQVNVRALTKHSAMQDLEASLANVKFSFKENGKNVYIVYKDDNKKIEQQKKSSSRGTLKGTVLDSYGFPIPGATVVISGMPNKGTATNIKGEFTLPDVPAREVTVEVSCISYQTMNISKVNVQGGKDTPLSVILQDATELLKEVVVTATYNRATANALYAKQKAMVAMSDGVSSDLIKKTADNNVAQVLKRVSGVTVENGKYVTVRGLGERYNNVQLNGSSLPSTEPNRRNFSFDIIPTALIDNVTIAKTFTPDMPGEFTGGLVEVNTLAVPEKPLISVSAGTGFNTNSTGKDFHAPKRLNGDYLFGNSRNWYGNDWKLDISNGMFDGGKGYDDLTDAEKKTLNAMDAKVPNNWGFRNYKGAPTQNYAITVGLPFDLGNNNKLGVIASLTYRHEENTDDLQEASYLNGDTLLRGNNYKFVTSTGAVANIGWERPGHKITWRNLFNNRFTHTSIDRIVYEAGSGSTSRELYSNPMINRLWQTQLSGEHKLPMELVLTWTGDYSKMERTAPDDRLAKGGSMNNYSDMTMMAWSYPVLHFLNDGFQMYSKLDESKKNIGTNLEYPFIVEGNKQKFKVGYMGMFRNSDYEQAYLQTQPAKIGAGAEAGSTLHETYSSDLYASGQLYLRRANDDFYHGKQQIHAAYLMGEFSFWKKLHLTAGVRMEAGNTETFTNYWNKVQQEYCDTAFVSKKTDWLPAVTAVYNILDDLNIRAAYSKTLARPDFRELSDVEYYNVNDRINVINLGNIRQSYTDNVDIRLEWYPQAGEVISVSAFYKKFKDPVELVSVKRTNDGKGYDRYTFNLKSATVKGLEFNIRKSFGFLAPYSFLNDLYFTANATVLKGNVDYDIYRLMDEALGTNFDKENYGKAVRNRPLQGLVPYAVNAGLSYSGKRFGAVINYGTTGRKLVQAGMYEKYDEYEAPRHVLDLQLSAKFLKERLEVKANASDLLNGVYRVYRNCGQEINGADNDKENTEPDKAYTDRTSVGMNYDEGDWIMNQYKRGTSYSFSVSYKF